MGIKILIDISIAIATFVGFLYAGPAMFYWWYGIDGLKTPISKLVVLGIVIGKTSIGLTALLLLIQMITVNQYPTILTLPGRLLMLAAVWIHVVSAIRAGPTPRELSVFILHKMEKARTKAKAKERI
jgi:hypothetical protein